MLFPWIYPTLPCDYDIPPTIYALLNSYVNFGKEDKTKIKNLAKEGRLAIFDFDYPLTDKITKEDFETLILNHYIQRRIGYQTVTAFKIALCSKLNEIMPIYNKLFDALDGWNLFLDGEKVTRETIDEGSNTSNENSTNTMTNNVTNSGSNISDRKYSKMPQNELTDIQNGSHLTDYNYDTDTTESSSESEGNGTSQTQTSGANKNQTNETITRTPADKLSIYKNFIENRASIYTMIFKELDDLFYGLI
jgi:hypothetical protein